ncbi:MAG: DCC1-like thiol-disulfide oxidoreductase family protein [Planctomycetales bacterium]
MNSDPRLLQSDDRAAPAREPRPKPDGPIVFFDGVCGLCDRAVNSIMAADRRGVFRFAPLQGETAARLLDRKDAEALSTLVLLDERGTWRRSSAVVRILRRLGGARRLIGALLWLVPKPLRDLGYRAVAWQRYRLFGKRDACRMPKPEERDRMLP